MESNGADEPVTRTMGGPEHRGWDDCAIGPYQLLQLIGEGGMGEVWLAEQKRPVRRRVAIKLIKAGMDTRDVVARFQSERQALALMDHPAIAKVFEAGSTPQGRPYFVMEYVPGVPITKFCDNHKLSMRDRIALFMLVCEGVQHAHHKAIIHRDLKPSNILVCDVDGKPMPRIIDFGVAKATAQRLGGETVFTRVGAIVGTLGYMSPEQADSGGEDIDTRSDVYSLGVVLYELLVGALPFDLNKLGLDEVLRRLRHEDTPRPSTKFRTTTSTSIAAAENRGADVVTLVRQLRGDLDAIALKALEKDRARRYAAPVELSADLGRYLRNEPVVAHEPGRIYLLRKLMQRNRRLVLSAAAVLLTLIAATVVSTREAAYAIRAERASAASLKEAQAVNGFLQEMLQSADPRQASKVDPEKGRDVTVAHVLNQAARRLDAGSLRGQPRVEAAARESLGTTFSGLGRYPEAEAQYRKALALRQSVPDEDAELATAESKLAEQLTFETKLAEADPLQKDALRIRTKLFGPDDPLVSGSLSDLAITTRREGKYPEAEALTRRALDIDIKNKRAQDAAIDEGNLGVVLRFAGRPVEAEVYLRRSLARWMEIAGANNPSTAVAMNQLAYVLHDQGKLQEAENYTRTSLETSRRRLGDNHPDVAVGLNHLATLLRDEGKLSEAESMLREALAVALHAWGPDQADTARVEANLGQVLAMRGNYREGENLLRQALLTREKILPEQHPDVLESEAKLGSVLVQERRFSEGEPLLLNAYRGLKDGKRARDASKAAVAKEIAQMYTKWSRADPAAASKAQLAAQLK